jgi:hypothetical protein
MITHITHVKVSFHHHFIRLAPHNLQEGLWRALSSYSMRTGGNAHYVQYMYVTTQYHIIIELGWSCKSTTGLLCGTGEQLSVADRWTRTHLWPYCTLQRHRGVPSQKKNQVSTYFPVTWCPSTISHVTVRAYTDTRTHKHARKIMIMRVLRCVAGA